MQIRTVADLGAVVKDTRHDRGITQAELAKMSGVSRNWIIALESGAAGRAEIRLILAVLAALDLPVQLGRDSHSTQTDGESGREEVPGFNLDNHLSSFITHPSRP